MTNLGTAPSVQTNNSQVTVNAGTAPTNSGTFGDLQGNQTVMLTASVGTIIQNNANGTWVWTTQANNTPHGPLTVTITATDNENRTAVTTFTVTNLATAPTIQANLAQVFANEGSAPVNSGTFFDAQGNQTVTLTASIGTVIKNDATGTWTWNGPTGYAPQSPVIVTITATDDQNATATNSFTYSILNLVDVSGRVFRDSTNDSLYNGSDVGIGGVTVQLWDQISNSLLSSTVTAGDGTYYFDSNLTAGTYRILEVLNEMDLNLLDGRERAGNLGGTVVNSQDSNTIQDIVVGQPGTTLDAVDYLFAEISPAELSGLVWEDFNNDGFVNFGEKAIGGAGVVLTGTDDRGNSVNLLRTTDADGAFMFFNLRPGNYQMTESQPGGFNDGLDVVGTVNGVTTGYLTSTNDVVEGISLQAGSVGVNYNFGERPLNGGQASSGQTAATGFWQNKKGRDLVLSLNGGPNSTQLGNWLAATFPNMYGVNGGQNNLTGKTNVEVFDFYDMLFRRKQKEAEQLGLGGSAKIDSQIFATALAVYVTNSNLAGTVATSYGFTVTVNGLGASTMNVGNYGEAFGAANGSNVSVLDLLIAVNNRSRDGVLFDLDGDGDANDELETSFRGMALNVFK